METTAAALAAELCGVSGGDTLLHTLCGAAEQAWERRLKSGVSKAECGEVLRCAAAFDAAADYLGRQAWCAGSFTVGNVTVKQAEGQSVSAMAEELRRTAERLMEPYAESGRFCFKGVRG